MARAKLAARSVAIVLALGAMCLPSAGAQRRGAVRIAVGEVGAVEGGATAAEALRGAMAETLARQPDVEVSSMPRAELVLRGSIVRWEQSRVEGALEVRCEVSVIVADARGGSIRAMLRGRGGARGGNDTERLSRDALAAAVRGALRPLSTAAPTLAQR